MNVGIRRIVRSELAVDPGTETGLLQFRYAFGRRPERQTVQNDDRERRRCAYEPIKIPETRPARSSCSSLPNRASLGILRCGIGEQGKDVFAVAALAQPLAQSLELGAVDETHAVGNLLDAGDALALALLDRADELAGFQQRLVSPHVEPAEAAAKLFHRQLATLQIGRVDRGDLQFAARRWFDRAGDVDDLVVVEVEPGDRPVGARLHRLLLDMDGAAGAVEIDDAVALRIAYQPREHRRPLPAARQDPLELLRHALA